MIKFITNLIITIYYCLFIIVFTIPTNQQNVGRGRNIYKHNGILSNSTEDNSDVVLNDKKTWKIFFLVLLIGTAFFCICKIIVCCFLCYFISKHEKLVENKNQSYDQKDSRKKDIKEISTNTKTASFIDTVSLLKTTTLNSIRTKVEDDD